MFLKAKKILLLLFLLIFLTINNNAYAGKFDNINYLIDNYQIPEAIMELESIDVYSLSQEEMAEYFITFAVIYIQAGYYDQALSAILQAEPIITSTNVPALTAKSNMIKSLLFAASFDLSNAAKHLSIAKQIIMQNNLLDLKDDIYEMENSFRASGVDISSYEQQTPSPQAESITPYTPGQSYLGSNTNSKVDSKFIEYKNAADNLYNQQKYVESIEWYQKAISSVEEIDNLDKNILGEFYDNLGSAYIFSDDSKNAVKYLEKATVIYSNVVNIDKAKYAFAYNKLGMGYFKLFDYKKSLENYLKAVDLLENSNYKSMPFIAGIYDSIGLTYASLEQFDNALKWYQKSYNFVKLTKDPVSTEIANCYNNLASVHLKTGKYDEAEDYNLKALEIYKTLKGTNHPDTAYAYKYLGKVYEVKEMLSKALEYYNLALQIEETQPQKDPTIIVSYNNIASIYMLQNKYDEALNLYKKSISLLDEFKLNQPTLYAPMYNNIGQIYVDLGKYEEAIIWFNKALAINEKEYGIDSSSTAINYINIAGVYFRKGDFNKAEELFLKGLNIREKNLGANSPENAPIYANLGMLMSYMGDYDKALAYIQKGIDILEKSSVKKPITLATLYNNYANILLKQGDYDTALKIFLDVAAMIKFNLGNNHTNLASTYSIIAFVYANQGRLFQALEWNFKAQDMLKSIYGNAHPAIVINYNNIACVYENLKDYDNALEWYFKALSMNESISNKDNYEHLLLYNNIASVYDRQKQYDKAIEYYFKCIEINNAISKVNNNDIIVLYSNIGKVYENKKDYLKAKEYFNKAISLSETTLGKDDPAVLTSYTGLGRVYTEEGQFEKAHENNLNALAISQKYNDRLTLSIINGMIAETYEKQNDYFNAMQNYEKAINALEEIRELSVVEEDKFNTTTDLLEYFGSAVNMALKMNDSKKSFEFSERSKAKNLIQSIASQDAKLKAGITKADLDKLNLLEHRLSEDKKLCLGFQAKEQMFEIENKNKTSSVSSLDAKKRSCDNFNTTRDKLAEYKKDLDSKYPRYYELRYPNSASYTDVQALFNKPEYNNLALIEYYMAPDKLYIWVISSNGISSAVVDIDIKELSEHVDTVIGPLRAASHAGNFDALVSILEKFDISSANKLYDILIKPVESSITGKNLVIVPSGILYYLPFELLVKDKNLQSVNNNDIALSNFVNVGFLGKEKALSYMPSASLMVFLEKNKNPIYNNNMLIVANPSIDYLQTDVERRLDKAKKYDIALNRLDNSIATRAISSRSSLLMSLPNSEVEGKFINDQYINSSDLLLGDMATEKEIKSRLGKYKDYHFSTHGIVDDQNPYLSGILLNRGSVSENEKEQGLDGILYAYELAGTNLNADTVVLSACDTGLGKMVAGEGMVGLSRSFLVAGANSVVISLWKVSDVSTSELMKAFYTAKASGNYVNKSDALRIAKNKLINSNNTDVNLHGYTGISYAHPYFWAPFILSGKW